MTTSNAAGAAAQGGALAGIRIIEVASIGPGPFACMMLADHGAAVTRIERPGEAETPGRDKDILLRTRDVVTLDLKKPSDVDRLRALARDADGLIEGFRPGVMERLGLGPDILLVDNPRLVYGRMTGWGQTGPLAARAGHDINYIATAGNLHGYGRAGEKPVAPVNAIADFGGGGMMMAFGMLAGIIAAQRTGRGQVMDCAMVDGAALLASMTWSFLAMNAWRDERGVNLFDSGAPFYDTYRTRDGGHVAIGPIEPKFYAQLIAALGLTQDPAFAQQNDPACWPAMRQRLTTIFLTRDTAEWTAILEPIDACFSPVLSMREAIQHPHNRARRTFIEAGGVVQPAPAPRFSETPAIPPRMQSIG
jgi:alpha-methylacyl-CoA racemase